MPDEIRATAPDDLPELGRFLVDAFGASPDAAFAAPDVLSWKYADPIGRSGLPRGLVAVRDGAIVGHIGLCPTAILRAGGDPAGVPAIHPIDWVVSDRGVGLGAKLLMRVHRMAEVHLAIGLTPSSAAMAVRTGYDVRMQIPVYRKVFRPAHRLRASGSGSARAWIGLATDAAGMLLRGRSPSLAITLESVPEFAPETAAIVAAPRMPVTYTRRDPDLLNHLLRFPRGRFSGWIVRRDQEPRGIGLLSVVPRGKVRVGKVVDCFLDAPEPDLWHAAVSALTSELRRQGADFAECFGTTPWLAEALRAAGYRPSFAIPFYLRDRSGLLPSDEPFHVTQLEADYSYT